MKRHHNREANQISKQPTKTQNEVGYSVHDHNSGTLEARERGLLLKCEDSLGYTNTGLARAIQKDLVSKSKAKQNKEKHFWSINVCIVKLFINKEAAVLRSWDKSFPLPLPRQTDEPPYTLRVGGWAADGAALLRASNSFTNVASIWFKEDVPKMSSVLQASLCFYLLDVTLRT